MAFSSTPIFCTLALKQEIGQTYNPTQQPEFTALILKVYCFAD